MINLEKHIKRNVINGRSLSSFERILGFHRTDLEGHKVLNFGSGGSNVGRELKIDGIDCEVVDVDILPNPHSIHDEGYRNDEYVLRRAMMERKVRDYNEGQMLLKSVEEYENAILGIEDRNFIQLDGSGKLPFGDGYFDDIFVSWVFHQLPEFERGNYLREFMRVGKRIFIAPVGGVELSEIEESLMDSQFAIKSLLSYGVESDAEVTEESKVKNRENGYTDDGCIICNLDIDQSQRPYAVGSAGCAMVILERK